VDVRVVSATNRDLRALAEEGAFREDLYWRVRGAEVELPPLRERVSDLPLLAAHFLNLSASLAVDGAPRVLSEEAERALARHDWPGNLRELRFEMQRATVLAGVATTIQPGDLSFSSARRQQAPVSLHQLVEELERREIEAALARCHGNRTRAAEALGLSRQGLLKKMTRYELQAE
jgi:transcriptional regulator with PAS, ATPase and Fis domain